MITIEEVIISSLYHRLVLVRIKKTPDVKTGDEVDAKGVSNEVARKTNGLGYLSMGNFSKKNENSIKDTKDSQVYKNQSIETRSLERVDEGVSRKVICFEEEEVFMKRHVGMMISVGEVHLMTKKPQNTTEVQTDFEPVWVVDGWKSGEVMGGLKGVDMVDLTNCNEFSLARLETLQNDGGDDEKRSLLMLESRMMENTGKGCMRNEESEGCVVRSVVGLKGGKENDKNSKNEKNEKFKPLRGLHEENMREERREGLVGSYKVFNLTDEGTTLKLEERLEEKEEGVANEKGIVCNGRGRGEEEGIGGSGVERMSGECGGIGDVLMPSSYVDFVVNRIEADSYSQRINPTHNQSINNQNLYSNNNPTSHTTSNISSSSDYSQRIQKQMFKDSEVDFSNVKFHQSREDLAGGRFATIGGGAFKDRRRVSQRRSRSARKSAVDGDKLLRHMMTCVGHEKSPSDVITITDFKLSPHHAFRSLNSSHADLRQHIDSEFASPFSSTFSTLPSHNKTHHSLSERSSPLMMTTPLYHGEPPDPIPPSTNPLSIPPSHETSNEWENEMMKSFSFLDDPSITTNDSSTITSPVHTQFEKFPDWMKKLSIKLKRRPLSSIAIPGSHISLAIDRDMKTSLDFSRCNLEMADFLHKLPNLPIFNAFRNQMKLIWRAWMSKQFLSVYQQLQAGSRYLDMQVGKHNNLLMGAHGLFTGHLKRYLKDVRLFLEEQPSEIVIIHISPTESLTPSDRKHLVTLLFQIFGSKMAAWEGRANKMASRSGRVELPSIQGLLDANKNLLVVMPTDDVINHVSKHIFGGAVWPDSVLRVERGGRQGLEELKVFLQECLERIKSPPSVASLPLASSSSVVAKASSSLTMASSVVTEASSLTEVSLSRLCKKPSSSSSSSSYATPQWFSSSTITDSTSSSYWDASAPPTNYSSHLPLPTNPTHNLSSTNPTHNLSSTNPTHNLSSTNPTHNLSSTNTAKEFVSSINSSESSTAHNSTTTLPTTTSIPPSIITFKDLSTKSSQPSTNTTITSHPSFTPAPPPLTPVPPTLTPAQPTLTIIQAVLSPDMSTVFGKYDGRKSMKELTMIDTSPIVVDWLSQKGEGFNVVAVDFIGCPGLVAAILAINGSLKR